MRGKFGRATAIGMALLMVSAGLVYADKIDADADALSTATPHPANQNVTQDPGATVAYTFSAHVDTSGNVNTRVFVDAGDTAVVGITRAGAWLAADPGSPASFTFTQYNVSQTGTIRVTVPCGTEEDVTEIMTVNMSATSLTRGSLNDAREITFTVASSGDDDPSCAPAYVATGFYDPVGGDDLLVAKAGRSIPLKWNLYLGSVDPLNEIVNPTLGSGAYAIISKLVSCNLTGTDDSPPFADDAGKSGLRYNEDGENQFNWQTNKSWAGTCREFRLSYDGQLVKTALFRFEK